MKKTKLNLGCGKRILKDFINVDITNYEGIDLQWDLNKLPLPFKEKQFEKILCRDILEHVNYIPLMDELHRILNNKGILIIRVPHFTNVNAYVDPTHKHFFSIRTFGYFIEGHEKEYPFEKFNKIKCHLAFEKRPLFFWNYLLEKLININEATQSIYERTPLRIFPAASITFTIQK